MRLSLLLRPALPARYAYVVLAGLSIVLSVLAYLAAVGYYHAGQASQARQAAAQKASQQRQGQLLEQRLCTTLDGLASLTPPSGATSDNPSRQYLAQLHAKLAELGPDVGCPQAGSRNQKTP